MLKYDYFSPTTIAEAIDVLNNAGDDTHIIAGGTDIIIAIRSEKIKPKVVVNINKIDEIKEIRLENGIIRIGAMVNFTTLERSELLKRKAKVLTDASREIGSTQIRNLGTIGGNIVTSSPAADSVAALVALDANVILKSKSGSREVKMVDFYDNGTPNIKKEEILVEVNFKEINENTATAFTRLVKRKALAIVVLSMGILVEKDKDNKCIRSQFSVGAVARNPIRLYEIEKRMIGEELKLENFEELLDEMSETIYDIILEGSPWRMESAEYKSSSIKGIAIQTFEKVLLELNK